MMDYILTEQRLLYHYLDLDYPIDNNRQHYVNQTNSTISRVMNDFVNKFKSCFNDEHLFILEYQDDLYGAIAYKILKNIQGIKPFNFKFEGSFKNTSKFIDRKDHLSLMKSLFLKKKQIHYISCINPIYYVKSDINYFRKISPSDYKIIECFTPTQFDILKEFYGIKLNRVKAYDFKEFCNNFQIYERYSIDKVYDYVDDAVYQKSIMYIYKMEGNEDDFGLYDEIRHLKENIVVGYYFKNKEAKDFTILNLSPFIKARNYIHNFNTVGLENPLKNYLIPYEFKGNWTEEEKIEVMRGV